MVAPISSALPGLSAAERRFDTQTVNLQNRGPASALPTAGTPIAEAAAQPPLAPPPSAVTPDGIEGSAATERESGFDSTYASLRSSTPSYLAVYDAPGELPDERGSMASESPDASQERADKTREEANAANQQTLDATNAVVQKRFNIGASY
jgi:hypothetical protein